MMCVIDVGVGGGNLGEDLLDGQSLPDHARRHDQTVGAQAVLCLRRLLELSGRCVRHGLSILESSNSRYGIGTAGVDYDASEACSSSLFKNRPAHLDWCGLKFVGREDGGTKGRSVRDYEC